MKSSEQTNEISTTHAMPLEIIKAIIAITGKVKKLAKEGNNTFQKYKFTSVDQFYEALGPLMSEHGLCDMAFERSMSVEMREAVDDRGVVKKSAWMTAEYDFVLYHESGVQSEPISRTIQVQATGAQSDASAQSFAEKYFLRNLFKIPTGDIDEVDTSDKGGLPTTSKKEAVQFITPEEVEELDELLVELGDGVTKGFKKYFQIEFLGRLPAADFGVAMEMLVKKKAQQKDAREEDKIIEEHIAHARTVA